LLRFDIDNLALSENLFLIFLAILFAGFFIENTKQQEISKIKVKS